MKVPSVFESLALLAAIGLPAGAQSTAASASTPASAVVRAFAPVPFGVGEELRYRATFGGIPAGSARMRVAGIELVRGRPTYHLVFAIDGGVPFFRVHDRFESWMDVYTLASLRHVQEISEGRYHRTTTYDIYPDRAEYRKNGGPMMPSVHDPLDDGSFIYAVRADAVRVGQTLRDERYFVPDRNPVVLTGVRHDTVRVDAGSFAATVVKPTIRTSGLFSENGDAQIWFSDDAARLPLLVKSKFAHFSLTLTLQSVTPGTPGAVAPTLSDASR